MIKQFDPKAVRRFWNLVDARGLDDCWIWSGTISSGTPRFNPYNSGLSAQASKTAYLLTYGEIPKGRRVRHVCGEGLCCNPFHLTLGDSDEERFWSFVDKTPGLGPKGECWEWTGYITKVGYGHFTVKKKLIRCRSMAAHRYSLMMATELFDQPEHIYACHHCDNRKCVRPDHLFWGTAKDNHADRKSKGRGIRKGLLTKQQVIEVKELLAESLYSQEEIGKMYKVSQGVISRIKLGKYIHCADSTY
jgi:hypothetical protein